MTYNIQEVVTKIDKMQCDCVDCKEVLKDLANNIIEVEKQRSDNYWEMQGIAKSVDLLTERVNKIPRLEA